MLTKIRRKKERRKERYAKICYFCMVFFTIFVSKNLCVFFSLSLFFYFFIFLERDMACVRSGCRSGFFDSSRKVNKIQELLSAYFLSSFYFIITEIIAATYLICNLRNKRDWLKKMCPKAAMILLIICN